jgi:hypothetical protein
MPVEIIAQSECGPVVVIVPPVGIVKVWMLPKAGRLSPKEI